MASGETSDWERAFKCDPPEMGRLEAERRLFADLHEAMVRLDSAEDFGRSGITLAAQAFGRFLLARGASGLQVKPVRDLVDALKAVDRGILPEVFDPQAGTEKVIERQRSRSPAASELKLSAAACLDALIRTKGFDSLDQAALYVARRVASWPQIGRPEITATTIINWRKGLTRLGPNDRKRAYFEDLANGLAAQPGSEKRIEALLREGPPATGGVRPRRSRS